MGEEAQRETNLSSVPCDAFPRMALASCVLLMHGAISMSSEGLLLILAVWLKTPLLR